MKLEAIVALAEVGKIQSNETRGIFRRVKFSIDACILGFANWRCGIGRTSVRYSSTYAISILDSSLNGSSGCTLCSLLFQLSLEGGDALNQLVGAPIGVIRLLLFCGSHHSALLQLPR